MKVIIIPLSCTTISIAMLLLLLAVFVPFLFEKSSVYGQQNTTTTTTTTTTMIGSKIPYYVFPAEIEGVEEEILKIPHDAFTVQTIVAKKGDNITIKFYNTEAEERHTFTLDPPYNINEDLAGSQNTAINFVADKEGIFTYYCIYHLPTMTGKLVVLPYNNNNNNHICIAITKII